MLDSFRRALLIQDYAAQAAIANALSDVVLRLQDAGEALQAEILALGDDVQPWQIERLERFRALEAQAIQEMADFGQSVNSLLPVAQANAAAAGANAALQSVSAIAGQAVTAASFRSLSGPALRELAAATSAGPLRALLDSFGPQASAILRQTLFEGLGQGQNARVVGRAIERTVGVGRQRAQVIARTEILRAGKSANLASFAANSNLISGWTWHAFKGPRTCSACLVMDGTEFPTTVTFFPGHPQCRCVAKPVLRDYPTPREQTGREYLESLPEAEQRALLGNRKYEAWQRGDLDLDDMVTPRTSDAWGTSYQEASLAQAEANAIARRAGGGVIPPQPTPVATTPAPAPQGLRSSAVQRGPDSPDWVGQYEYPTPDADLTPEMLNARYRIAAGEDPAQFGEIARVEALRRSGFDEQGYAKYAELENIINQKNNQFTDVTFACFDLGNITECDKIPVLEKELTSLRNELSLLDSPSFSTNPESVRTTIQDLRPDFGSSTNDIKFAQNPDPFERLVDDEIGDFFNQQKQNFPKSVWDDLSTSMTNENFYVKGLPSNERGAFWRIVREISMEIGPNQLETANHELWHAAEAFTNKQIIKSEKEFLIRRILPGEQPSLIYVNENEIGYRDSFFKHYVGKQYSDVISSGRELDDWDAFEVGSMAMGELFGKNSRLAAMDPDHAAWFISLLLRM